MAIDHHGDVNLLSDLGVPYTSTTALQVDLAGAKGATVANGLTGVLRISTADTNLVSLKATVGKIYGGCVVNTTASWKYLKLYSKASAPVLASDVPLMVIGIPPNTTLGLNGIVPLQGMSFALGIAYAITGGFANTDTTVLAVGDVLLSLLYI